MGRSDDVANVTFRFAARPAARGWKHGRPIWAIGLAAATLTLAGLCLVPTNRRVPEAALSYYAIPDLVAGLVFSVIGAWLVARRPDNAVCWLLLVVGLGSALSSFSTQYAATALVSLRSHHLPLGSVAGALAQVSFIVPNVVLRCVIPYAFPDGRLVGRGGRAVLVAAGVLGVAMTLAVVGEPDPSYGPLAVPALAGFSRNGRIWVEGGATMLSGLSTLVLIRRGYRRPPPERAPYVCFSIGAVMLFVAFTVPLMINLFVPGTDPARWIGPSLTTVALIVLAGSAVVAVLRYRLWDIDLILRRSLVFASLTLCLAAGYLALVTAAKHVFSDSGLASSLAAAMIVAAVATPLRSRLQQGVNRLLYGERQEPDAAVARLGRRLSAVNEADAVLPELAAVIAASLKVPYVAVAAGEGGSGPSATWGRAVCGSEAIMLTIQGEGVGRLHVGYREPGVALEGPDRRLLDDLVRQAALAVATVRRREELQDSRQRLVGAREEERRRLRRDLHDGLGPALAAITLRLDEAHELVNGDPGAARRLLSRLRAETQQLIGEIRRLVYDLRPPTLDELGLVGAIREHAGNLSGGPMLFEVVATEECSVIPAAVEVALWRIATEAMTNVVRHAGACHCVVMLTLIGRAAELEILDDGCGIDGARSGVGLSSARERAAELGGRFTVGSGPEGGTRVWASLPLGPA